jgi:glycosyltransferase involved in cell wall biosynthesis
MRLTVIVPVRNGGDALRRCLDALRRGTHPPDELIVVDDASTDGSAALAESFGATVLRLDPGPHGPAVARNRGAAVTTGDALLFFDADVVAHADTVERIAQHLAADPGIAALFGSYDDDPPMRGVVARYKNLSHHYVHQHGRAEAGTFWAGCGTIRREAFAAVGGFDESYARPSIEDIELGVRLRNAGYRIRLCPDVQVAHLKRWTFVGLLRSDIRDRAIPWSQLIAAMGRLPDDLNLDSRNRLSAVAAWGVGGGLLLAAGLALLGVSAWVWAALAALVAAACLLVLNRAMYGYLARHGARSAAGRMEFACAAVFLHWLYLLYSSAILAVVLASARLRPAAAGRAEPTSRPG